MKNNILGIMSFVLLTSSVAAQSKQDAIVGKWMSTEGNLMVQVYKYGSEFKAVVLWFDDSDDKSKPYYARYDTKNPDHSLRWRKILGMEVMHGLVYNADDDEWQDGRIYDASTGKDWNAKAWLTKDGCLKVRGFWHFEFLGQNMCFKKVS